MTCYRLKQIIVTAEASRTKPCRSFTYHVLRGSVSTVLTATG